jgi:hypothetical protein
MEAIESPDETESGDRQADQLFLRSGSAGGSAVLWAVGGCAALGFAVFGMLIALVARVDQLSLHAMTTLPALIGLGALGAAWRLARTPGQVAVGPRGICIEGSGGSRWYTWDEIGWATIGTGALNHRRHLVIFDTAGKTIAKLGDAFDDFDALAELVQRRIAGKGDDTAERLQTRKAKRSALFCGSVGVVFLAVAGGHAWIA